MSHIQVTVKRLSSEQAGRLIFGGNESEAMQIAFDKIEGYQSIEPHNRDIVIDDVVYLMLRYFKANGVNKPFEEFYELVTSVSDESTDEDDGYARLRTRLAEDKELIDKLKDPLFKPRASEELKKRGFIGGRVINGKQWN